MQGSHDGEVGGLGSSCLSRASLGSVKQPSLGLGMRPELWDFAETYTHE